MGVEEEGEHGGLEQVPLAVGGGAGVVRLVVVLCGWVGGLGGGWGLSVRGVSVGRSVGRWPMPCLHFRTYTHIYLPQPVAPPARHPRVRPRRQQEGVLAPAGDGGDGPHGAVWGQHLYIHIYINV